MSRRRRYAPAKDAILVVLAACGAPRSPAKAPDPVDTSCDGLVDRVALRDEHEPPARARVSPDAVLSWHLDDGAPGYVHEMLLEVTPTRQVHYIEITARHDEAPSARCWRATVDAAFLDALDAELTARALCAQKRQHPDPDIPEHRIHVSLPRTKCDAVLDYQPDMQSPEGRASYQALERIIPRAAR
jgi:hypothetical protein